MRQVKLGRQVGDQVEVLAGLQAGDRITLPHNKSRAARGHQERRALHALYRCINNYGQ